MRVFANPSASGSAGGLNTMPRLVPVDGAPRGRQRNPPAKPGANGGRWWLWVAWLWVAASLVHADDALTVDQRWGIKIELDGQFDNAGDALRDLLTDHLRQVLKRDQLEAGNPILTIRLRSDAGRWQDLPVSELTSVEAIDAYRVTVRTAPEPVVELWGRTAVATGFAAMDFLEHEVGLHWVMPGPLGLDMPTGRQFTLRPTERSAQPAQSNRMFSGLIYRDEELTRKHAVYAGALQEEALFFKSPAYFKSLRLHSIGSASHALMHVFKLDELAQTDPEMLPLKDGKRLHEHQLPRDFHSWQPCYSHPRTNQLGAEAVLAAFRKGGGMIYSLGVNDGKNTLCECDGCKALGWPDAYYQFVSHAARQAQDFYPPRMVGVLAYGSARQPPSFKLPDNVLVLITGSRASAFEQWSQHARHLGAYEYLYGYWYFWPVLPLKAMADNARYYQRNHVNYLYGEAYPLWGFDAPKLALRAQLMWEPELDLPAALGQWCADAFGAAGPAMTRLYQHWADKADAWHRPGTLSEMAPLALRQSPVAQLGMLSAADYAFTFARLEEAEQQTLSEVQRARLAMVRGTFAFGQGLFALFDALAQVDAGTPLGQLARLQQVWDQHQQHMQTLEQHPDWFAGSAVTYEKIAGPEWLGGWSLEDRLETARQTTVWLGRADLHGHKAELPAELQRYLAGNELPQPPKVHVRPTHPWYPEPRWAPLQTQVIDPGTFSFTSAPVTAMEEIENPWQRQWASAMLLKVKVDGTVAYQVELEAQGAGGLELWVHNGHNNRSRAAAVTQMALRPVASTQRQIMVIEPRPLGRQGQRVVRTPGVNLGEGMIDFYLSWRPTDEQSKLRGQLRVRELRLPAPVEGDALPSPDGDSLLP